VRGVRDEDLQALAVRQTTTRAVGGVLNGPLPVPDARELERAVRGRGVRGRHRGGLAVGESDADGGGARVLEGLGVEHRAEARLRAVPRGGGGRPSPPGVGGALRTHHDATAARLAVPLAIPRGPVKEPRRERVGSLTLNMT
jgi:hypothetical protein